MNSAVEIAGLISLNVIECHGLPAMDLNGKADPFFIVEFATRECYRSRVIEKTRTPQWNETCKIVVGNTEKNYAVHVRVYDYDKASANDFIGTATIEVANLFNGKIHDWYMQLENPKKAGKDVGTIHVCAKLMNKTEVETAFWTAFAKHFDTDDSGTINQIEFTAMIGSIHTKITFEETVEMFTRADKNGDGEVSFSEACALFITDEKLIANLKGNDPNFIWHTYARSDDYNTVANLVLNKNFVHPMSVTVDKTDKKIIMVHNYETGKLEEEKIPHYIDVALRIMYSTHKGRTAVENSQVRKLLHHLSITQGKKYDDPRSKKEIQTFIDFHKLNTEEILDPLDSFANFNEFFYRKLKPGARPVSAPLDGRVAVSPADCRMLLFTKIDYATELWIKGKNFNLETLLQDPQYAAKFVGGCLVIARLAPQDYHRFHLPVNCKIGQSNRYEGALYTVNPVAIRADIDIYTENTRTITKLESAEFGSVAYVAVGATMVGSINLTTYEGKVARKGDEQGYFAFGGSTVLLLFEPNRIKFDDDLVANSSKPIETLIKMGHRIGVSLY